ncbi:MAG: DUF4041 domain-containing protein [Bacteroidota bacterium]
MELFILAFLATVCISFALCFYLIRAYKALDVARKKLHRYSRLSSQEEYQRSLDADINNKNAAISYLKAEEIKLNNSIDSLSRELSEIEEEVYLESFGFYQPKYDFISVGSYEDLLKKNKEKQKALIRKKEAVICPASWSVEGSKRDGKKMVDSFRKLILNIFNGECDSRISRMKHSSNVNSIEDKIVKCFHKLNKSAEVIRCEITQEYLDLKIKQLYLQHEREIEKYEASEREKSIREEKRERKRAEKFEKESEEAQERKQKFEQQLQVALTEQKLVHGVEKKKLEQTIQKLRTDIEKAEKEKAEADSKVAMTKAGYVYVVSNIGSLGKKMFRIFVTRSSDPDKVIDAMSRMVPFPFDVHMKFVSEEASDTISRLQAFFSERRVNKANERRDFYYASLDEIERAVREIKEETGAIRSFHIDRTSSAYEYRRTRSIEEKDRSGESTSGDVFEGREMS